MVPASAAFMRPSLGSDSVCSGTLHDTPFSQPVWKKQARSVVVAAKKKQDWRWDAKEVILDQDDLTKLEFSRMLGMSREMSIAKIVAKKLNPSATNLELEKIIRQKGVKVFMNMISDKWKQAPEQEQGTSPPRKPDSRPVMKQKLKDAPLPLAPKPGSSNAGSSGAAGADPGAGWTDMSQERFRKLLDERSFEEGKINKLKGDEVELSPRPGSSKSPLQRPANAFSIALRPNDLSNNKLWELVGESSRLRAAKPPPPVSKPMPSKAAPPLLARPSRGSLELATPGAHEENALPKKKLPVPGLNVKPEFKVKAEAEKPNVEPVIEKSLPVLNRPAAFQDDSQPDSTPEEETSRDVVEAVQVTLKGPPLARPILNKAVTPSDAAQLLQGPAIADKPADQQAAAGVEPSFHEQVSQVERPLPVPTKAATSRIEEPPPVEKNLPILKKPATFRVTPPALPSDESVKVPLPRPANAPVSKKEENVDKPLQFESPSSEDKQADALLPLPGLTKPPAEAQETENSLGSSERNEGDQAVSNTEARRRPGLYIPSEIKPKPQYFPKAAEQEEVDKAWAQAEVALGTKEIQEVLFVGSNSGGMIARFGCITGFLPGKELCESRGLKTFRGWASEKGHDVNHASAWDSTETPHDGEISQPQHPACEADLHQVYTQERAQMLSTFVGQKAKVVVVYMDRIRRKLIFSERKAVIDNSEAARRRKELIDKLTVGDVITGKVKNFSLFGVFVEVAEDVTGLIQFVELSWTPSPDPTSIVQIGQELQLKVVKLDHDRQHIYLSLKRMTPDPLLETVESMLAKETHIVFSPDETISDEALPSCEELDDLLSKLETREDIESVSRGQYLHGVAVVPNFQVYLSSEEFSGAYKLLARFGNEVQEVILQTQADRERMKSIILEVTQEKQDEVEDLNGNM